jgi:hypothetical protein
MGITGENLLTQDPIACGWLHFKQGNKVRLLEVQGALDICRNK